MDKLHKFIDCYIPVTTCNLRCKYCYIAQKNLFKNQIPKFEYSPEFIGKALSTERLGGKCHLNFCGGGETLLPKEIPSILYELLKQGHYIFVVTNGTLTKRFEEISQFPKEYLDRLGFKFSFHYQELKERKLMDVFFDNVNLVKQSGCSFSVELTTFDDLIDEVEEIKKICYEKLGALCHITVGRDDTDPTIPIMTKMSRDEYKKFWDGHFDSEMLRYKLSTYNIKRKEFCYAGDWSGYLNIGTGEFKQCYKSNLHQNIYKNIDKPIQFLAMGKCKVAHCYNSHAFLTLGLIPELKGTVYSEIRNRQSNNGNEWLTKSMNDFISQRLDENNEQYTNVHKYKTLLINKVVYPISVARKAKDRLFKKNNILIHKSNGYEK